MGETATGNPNPQTRQEDFHTPRFQVLEAFSTFEESIAKALAERKIEICATATTWQKLEKLLPEIDKKCETSYAI